MQQVINEFATIIGEFVLQPRLLALIFGASLILFVGSILLIPVLVAKVRVDYFVNPSEGHSGSWINRHPSAKLALFVVKNFLGITLLISGVIMLVLPGQGIITVLIALTLLDFPGKRSLEIHLIRQKHVQTAFNWIRRRAGQPQIMIPNPSSTKEEKH